VANLFGLGPVFAYEWLIASRRWQMYAARSLFVALILIGIGVVWWTEMTDAALRASVRPSIRDQARVGEKLFYAIVGIQLSLVLLAAPAATAGSVCLDKTRGTLTHLLVTDLRDREIILGKLAARLVPVMSLVGCCLPILFLGTLFGGMDPGALVGAVLVTFGVAVFGCVLALTLSVWAKKAYEVLLATYMVWILLLLVYPLWTAAARAGTALPPAWLAYANPFLLAFVPYIAAGSTTIYQPLCFLGVVLAVSAGLLVLAINRVRAVTIRQESRPQSNEKNGWHMVLATGVLKRWLPGPSMEGNPVFWRDWYYKRPSRWVRVVWLAYVVLALVSTGLALREIFTAPGPAGKELAILANAFQTAIALVLLSAASVMPVADERVKGTLEVLLATPLTTPSIVWAKWWAAYYRVPLLVILPAVLAGTLAWQCGRWQNALLLVTLFLGYAAVTTSLGLALAVYIRRLGRAVAIGVTIQVLAGVGWFILLVVLFLRAGDWLVGMAMASPLYACGALTADIIHPFRENLLAWWSSVWTILSLAVAAALYLLVRSTFDRQMGRIRQQPWRYYLQPSPGEGFATPEILLALQDGPRAHLPLRLPNGEEIDLRDADSYQ
jgi:ABC-type transport system involved in multi-copper enzyme maturation permease subunit